MNKKLELVLAGQPAQVGDGFFINRAFPTRRFPDISPFLLLDHAGPTEFSPTDRPRGVDEHPHRGFETVTIVFKGALEHRDSAGNSGKLGPGDVQWMTAGSGLVHEEKHERNFAKEGGVLEMIQLWVNLPAADKMVAPKYQEILAAKIPVIHKGNSSKIRLIAGDLEGQKGAASTFTDLQVWDVQVGAGDAVQLSVKNGQTGILYMLSGAATINQEKQISTKEVAFFATAGDKIEITAQQDSQLVWLGGAPIKEPVFSYGPFVMNTEQEIVEAINDFRSGKMGTLTPA